MTIYSKVLADGQLPASKTTLYTAPDGFEALISMIIISSNTATTQTVQIYLKPSGTSRRILYVSDIGENEGFSFGTGIQLEPGDIIEGETTTASQVDYVIMGNERVQPS